MRCDFSAYPDVARWLENMKSLKSWDEINEVLYQVRDSVAQEQFETI